MNKIKTIIALMFVFFGTIGANADNEISVPSFEIEKGSTAPVTFDICLTSADGFTNKGVQFYITLPEGLNWADADEANNCVKLTSRMTVGMGGPKFNTGVCRVIDTGTNLTAGEGAIYKVTVVPTETFEGGNILISNIKVAGVKQSDVTTVVTVKSNEPSPDGLYVESFVVDKKILENESEADRTITFNIALNREEAIANKGVQFYITLPTGLNWADASEANNCVELTDRITVGMGGPKFNSGVCRVIDTGTNITAGDGAIYKVTVIVDKTFEGGNILLSNIKIAGAKQDDVTYKVTVQDATAINNAIVNIEDNAVVYNIAGQRVNANAKGIIIKNGKKFIAQ